MCPKCLNSCNRDKFQYTVVASGSDNIINRRKAVSSPEALNSCSAAFELYFCLKNGVERNRNSCKEYKMPTNISLGPHVGCQIIAENSEELRRCLVWTK